MDIKLANPSANVDSMVSQLETTTRAGAELTIFPECTLTGYCFETFEEAYEVSESVDGLSVSEIGKACKRLGTHTIFGFLEREGDRIFNSVACFGPDGLVSKYRKVHLPTLGVDNFTTPGDMGYPIFELALKGHDKAIRIGMNICYDCSFPESARVLMLGGVDLIALPTNWPPGSGLVADVIPNARALENNVYFAAINRIGTERGFDFIGKSKICDPMGRELDFANHSGEAIVYADVDVDFARRKHLVAVPGKHEVHRVNDRRPDTYGKISKAKED